jgi:hypothetical protein
MRNQHLQNDDEEMMNQNIYINTRGPNQNIRRVENTSFQNPEDSKKEKDFMSDIFKNPKEALAKEVIERAQAKLTQTWYDRFKCNLE